MSNQYNLVLLDNEYHFRSDSGEKYVVYIIESKIYNQTAFGEKEEIKIYHIGFSKAKSDVPVAPKFDNKIRDTILAIFMKFIENHPDDAFLYICDDESKRARHRSIVFGTWFNEYETMFSLFRHTHNNPSLGLYTSLIVLDSNPLKQFYINAFEYTLRDLYEKE